MAKRRIYRAARIPPATLRVGWDLWRAEREGGHGIARRRDERLKELVDDARTRSPHYRDLYADVPRAGWRLSELPQVNKQQLMADFDNWLTDPRFTRTVLEDFVADPDRVGEPFIDDSFVCTSSGTSGHPGLFVHDRHAVAVQLALPYVRGFLHWLDPGIAAKVALRGLREAAVVGAGGHFGGAGWIARSRLGGDYVHHALGLFPAQVPIRELIPALEAYDPTILIGYPSALELLADEQLAGRAHLRPLLASTSGESLTDEGRRGISSAWSCPVFQAYAASESMYCAFECRDKRLHLSSDWVILEPVDRQGNPTPPGEFSHTVLLTNLANRLQPVIRYDLGDSVQPLAGPCACGSPLPGMRVVGRSGDVVYLRDASGSAVPVLPLAIATVVDQVPGVQRCQVVQRGPAELAVHLEPADGCDRSEVMARLVGSLGRFLTDQHLPAVVVTAATEPPRLDPHSGKFRRVVPLAGVGPPPA